MNRRRAWTLFVVLAVVLIVAAPSFAEHRSRVGEQFGVLRGHLCTGGPNDVVDGYPFPCLEDPVVLSHANPVDGVPDGPFHIVHGWDVSDFPVEGFCFDRRNSADYSMELFIDGRRVGTQYEIHADRGCWTSQWWIKNFAKGLSGVHTFQVVFSWPEDFTTPAGFVSPLVFAPVQVDFGP